MEKEEVGKTRSKSKKKEEEGENRKEHTLKNEEVNDTNSKRDTKYSPPTASNSRGKRRRGGRGVGNGKEALAKQPKPKELTRNDMNNISCVEEPVEATESTTVLISSKEGC